MFKNTAILTLLGIFASALAGCGDKAAMSAGIVPPPPPPSAAPAPTRTYDYSHAVLETTKSQAGRKWTVAILRFGDTAAVEDVPWGPQSQPAPEGGGQVNVNVKIVGAEAAPQPSQAPPQLNKRAREVLKHALIKSEAFNVVERERIVEIIREVNFGSSKYADPRTAPDQGELVCVRYIIEGSLGVNEDMTLKDSIDKDGSYRDADSARPGIWDNVFSRNKVNREQLAAAIGRLQEQRKKDAVRREFRIACYLSVYDVRSGQVVTSVMGLGRNGMEAIDDAIEDLIDELASSGSSPQVAAASDQKVYIDVGAGGVKVGQRFQVVRQGQAIRDRDGQPIGHEETEIAEIEVVEVGAMMSVAKPVQAGAAIQRGDVLKPAKH